MVQKTEDRIYINNENDLIDALSKFQEFYLAYKEGNASYWKWCVIAMHMALQDTFVIYLQTTNPFGVVVCNPLKIESMQPKERERLQISKMKLRDFMTLYEQTKSHQEFVDTQQLPDKEEWNNAVKSIHELYRNPLIHLSPVVGSFDVEDTESILIHALDIIAFLVNGKPIRSFFYRDANKDIYTQLMNSLHNLMGDCLSKSANAVD